MSPATPLGIISLYMLWRLVGLRAVVELTLLISAVLLVFIVLRDAF